MIIQHELPCDARFMAPVQRDDFVRLGRDHDGGYIVPSKCLAVSHGLLGFGVCDDWSFEQQWHVRQPECKIQVYDGTVSPARMQPDLLHSYRDFFGDVAQHFPVNVGATSNSTQTSFQDAMIRMNRVPVFVKMDIEGSEWQMTDGILQHADSITGLVIEFHKTDTLRSLFYHTVRRYQEHFDVVHLHANTSCGLASDGLPKVIEITFLHQDFRQDTKIRLHCHLPGLDQSNINGTEDWALYWNA